MDTLERQPDQGSSERDAAIEARERMVFRVESAVSGLTGAVTLNYRKPEPVEEADYFVADTATEAAELDQQVAEQAPEVQEMADRLLREAATTREQTDQIPDATTEAEKTAEQLESARSAIAEATIAEYPADFAHPVAAQAAELATMEQTGIVAPEVNQALDAYLSEPGSMN